MTDEEKYKTVEARNAATLREAVEAIVRVGYPHNFQHEAPHIRGYCYDITKAIDKCFAALAKPPRNCDKYSHEEALRIWSAEPENPMNGCFDEWLYLPAAGQEGGAK